MQRFNLLRGFVRRLQFETLEVRRVLATFMVTSLSDGPVSVPGAAPGTLRQAVYDANHSAGTDVIQFAAGLSGTINLSIADDSSIGASALLVSSPITIQGSSSSITIARSSGAADMRLFHVTSAGDLTLNFISITGGVIRGTNATNQSDFGGEARGGAIYNEGTLHFVASTLYANEAIGGNGGMFGGGGTGQGGAIYSDGGSVTITDATISGSTVQTGTGSKTPSSFGGAVYLRNGTLKVYNSTITNGTASTGRGIYILAQNGTASADIWSSIIAQDDAPIQDRDFLPTIDAGGHLTVTGGNNLIRTQGDYEFITVSTADPMLGPLGNNGGPTMTHALLAGSPAINLGNNLQSLASDQRGSSYARVVGGTADIGAFESQSVSGPSLTGDYSGNHSVDAADYVLWRMTFGTSVLAHTSADGNGNGAVDAADYAVWRSNFGSTGSSGSSLPLAESAVPTTPIQVPRGTLELTAVNSTHSNNIKPLKSKAVPDVTTADLGLLNLVTPAISSTAHETELITSGSSGDSSQSSTSDREFDRAIWEHWSPIGELPS
jgi:hypothetical protein